MKTGKATIEIARPVGEVWAAITDVTRMGEWSPECVAGRWLDSATGPAVGAKFEGDNEAKMGGRVVKRWTTTSEVTGYEPTSRFEFSAEGYTTWTYELEATASGTRVTETFAYTPQGFMGFVYERLLFRSRGMRRGMQRTLARLKAVLEK